MDTTSENNSASPAPAGWYPDPAGSGSLRFFDGAAWTGRTRARDTTPRGAPATSASPTSVYASPFLTTPRARSGAAARHHPLGAAPTTAAGPFAAREDRAGGERTETADLLAAFLSKPTVAPPPQRQRFTQRARRVWRAAARRRPDRRRGVVLRGVGALLTLASFSVLGYSLYESFATDVIAQRSQHDLRERYTQLAAAVTTVTPAVVTEPPVTAAPDPLPDPATLPEGEVAGRLLIPAIGVDQVVVIGTASGTLKKGPGVWVDGVYPGAPGNATIAGHRTTYGAPFRHLDDLQPGDRIIFQAPGRPDAVFEVRGSQSVRPSQVSVTYQTPGVRLTLTTCEPVGSASQRLVVQAELVEGEHAAMALPAQSWTFQS